MSVADHADAPALLGDARRVRTRVRGFALWAPRGTTLELLEQVRGVLDEYEETPAQITQYGLEAAPPKATDKRAFRGRTCQAEALAPDVLASILREAIEARIDGRAYARVLARERRVRRDLLNRLRE